MYAGGKLSTDNNTYYLYTNQTYWTLSPYNLGNTVYANGIFVYSSGAISRNPDNLALGLRPVVSLTPTSAVVSGGDGTSTNPYVIQTS